ncbi:LacI family DNA-binding transcriptional regulator [Actinopolymorpha pittospori]|uniref:DNA-binding LacI/PurR family transcriptional regulator n=1 Tax=Actinopolymorpha pittospori TaxID=648752 RepID=A0A927MYN7_9ACTN|nr:LacI family DNA-binding transcriptional regulator [Actinopolymorpha pittospori]MBE1605742.1 DNA-binding LacI/PurR family transcriptional regulator [Actinopolymorpha pittospori]
MNTERRPTLRQVADLAGVSHQTVSRYFRPNSGLLPETAERVRAAVETLGYRPNLVARSMRTRRSGMLGVVLPGWVGPERTVAAACEEARSSGYRVEIVIGLDEGPESLWARVEELLASGQVEGVLSVSPMDPADLAPAGMVVQVDEYDHRLRAVDAVAEDQETMIEIVRRLSELGHRDLLHVGGPQGWPSARLRMAGYLEACRRYGLRTHGEPSGPWHPETGRQGILALPDDTPVTAVVAASDDIGVGVLGAAHSRGWAVPGRLSVTGWDDRLLARYAAPALSTVIVDRETAGRHAMRRLIAAVEGRPEPAGPTTPLTRIEFRESTGPPMTEAS